MIKNDPYTQESYSQIKEIKQLLKYMNKYTKYKCQIGAFFYLPMYFFH